MPPPPLIPPTYAELADALQATAVESLAKRTRVQPGWFAENATELRALIDTRNASHDAYNRQPTAEARARLIAARSKLQACERRCKSGWIVGKCKLVNDGIGGAGGKVAWDTIKVLKNGGLKPARRGAAVKMQKADGTRAESAEENAEVHYEHYEKLLGRAPTFDPSVLEQVPQRPTATGIDHPPTDSEIRRALAKLRDTAPGESGLPASVWKALGATEETFALVRQMAMHFWETEEVPTEWETGLLAILAKKGDLSMAGNYRGIMMLEVAYKLNAYILLEKLKPVKEGLDGNGGLDHESQCGFRGWRGCLDAIFTVKTLAKKRREHGLETWLLFIDLVKAFDRVPRELLWKLLARQGVPPKIISLLVALHKTVNVKFEVDGVAKTLLSIIGVKQGDVLGPDLFIFLIAGIMETWRSEHTYDLCVVRTARDFTLSGRESTAPGHEFSIADSEYADDTGMPFCSRADVEEQTPHVLSHFGRWGMEVHAGVYEALDDDGEVITPFKKSKSEILFCAAPASYYANGTFGDPDLSDVKLPGGRFMQIVDKFPYLGSIISGNCGDAADVDSRIAAASRAFGALRSCVFSSSSVTRAAKRMVYERLVLAILLYGSECWCLTEELFARLRVFHAQCLRVMSRVTRKHTWDHHISTQALGQELGIDGIDMYVTRRQLRWLGHVSRMNFERLPRQMLSSWVPSDRPQGAPQMTYGRTIKKALKKFGIDYDTWPELAADRALWSETLRLGYPAIRRSRRIAQRPRVQLPAALHQLPARHYGGQLPMAQQ